MLGNIDEVYKDASPSLKLLQVLLNISEIIEKSKYLHTYSIFNVLATLDKKHYLSFFSIGHIFSLE